MTLQANNPVAPLADQEFQDVPLNMVGGSTFGRYSKISNATTYNMIVSDGFLVPYAGYRPILITNGAVGRGIYSSNTGNFMIVVIDATVYRLSPTGGGSFSSSTVGTLATGSGDVYITENNGKQIVITDTSKVYVYAWGELPPTFYTSVASAPGVNEFVFPFSFPGYCSFQNGRVIVACLRSQQWVLSDPAYPNNAKQWVDNVSSVSSIQTKPGYIQAAVPVPGAGNNLLVFGTNVAESWQDLGTALFPYQRSRAFNLDYGTVNASSIDDLDNFVVWIATNETSGPTIMVSEGANNPKSISTDGIDFELAHLVNPANVTGFLFRQDGHLIYQFTFPDNNLSLAYDFQTKLFFNVTDEQLNYHPAKQVVFFAGSYYFASLKDGNVYLFDTSITDADYGFLANTYEIPKIRITPPLRLPSQRQIIGRSVGFTIENGQQNPISNGSENIYSSVSMYESRDGGISYGGGVEVPMNLTGGFKSRFIYQRLGIVNDASFKFEFNGLGRFVVGEGVVEIYQ